jgi:uncharacterized protein (TIGR00369 family)
MAESLPSPSYSPVSESQVNGHSIPDQVAITGGHGVGRLAAAMGILVVKCTAEHSIAVMPVEGNQQPFGLLHGGAHCVLGESLGSMSANAELSPGQFAVGVDINATHTASPSTPWVTGEARAIHLGGSLAVHEIVVTDGAGRRCSTIRITNAIRTRR